MPNDKSFDDIIADEVANTTEEIERNLNNAFGVDAEQRVSFSGIFGFGLAVVGSTCIILGVALANKALNR